MRFSIILAFIIMPLLVCASETKSFDDAMKGDGGGRYLLDNAEFALPKIPVSVDEFIMLRDSLAQDPRGGYVMFICAMIVYGKNKELGLQCMTLMLDQSLLKKGGSKPAYKGYSPGADAMYLIRQIDKFPWLGAIYIDGCALENSYSLPAKGPYVIRFNQLTLDETDQVRLYAFTSSGNLPRPITLKKNDKGLWKALNISSVVVGPSNLPKAAVKKDDL
jgi:hypothetical protein